MGRTEVTQQPAQLAPAAPLSPAAPDSRAGAPPPEYWTWLGPEGQAGRTWCTALNLAGNKIDVGSDKCGYWSGDPLAEPAWLAHGDELHGGVTRMAVGRNPANGERVCVVRDDVQLFYSDNDGDTWAASAFDGGETITSVKRLLRDGMLDNVDYLLAQGHSPNDGADGWLVMSSVDAGANWTLARFATDWQDADLWAARTAAGTHVALAYDDGSDDYTTETSDDNMATWEVKGVLGLGEGQRVALSGSEAGSPTLYLMVGTLLWRSSDYGATYDQMSDIGTDIRPGMLCASIRDSLGVLWGTSAAVYHSEDGGASAAGIETIDWEIIPYHLHRAPLAIDCLPLNLPDPAAARRSRGTASTARTQMAGERFYIATGGGTYIYLAPDSDVRLITVGGFWNGQYSDVISRSTPDAYNLIGASRDRGLHTIFGNSLPVPSYLAVYSTIGTDVRNLATSLAPSGYDPTYWSNFPGNLLVIAGGGVFSAAFAPTPSLNPAHSMLVPDPTTPYAVYWGAERLYRIVYDPGMNTFTTLPVGPDLFAGTQNVTGFAIAPTSPSLRYMTLTNGNAYVSTNGGTTWNPSGTPGAMPVPPDPQDARVKILVSPTNPNDVYIAGNYVAHSRNGGSSWSSMSAGYPGGTGTWDISLEGTGDSVRVYIATDVGPYRWDGATWNDLAPPGGVVPDVPFRAVEAVPSHALMRWATWGRGIFDYATGNTVAVNDPAGSGVQRLELGLGANPWQGASGRISYAIPAAGEVSIDVFDVAGARVASVFEGKLPAGRGTVSWDGRDAEGRKLASGGYYVRLRAGGATEVKKLVVLR